MIVQHPPDLDQMGIIQYFPEPDLSTAEENQWICFQVIDEYEPGAGC